MRQAVSVKYQNYIGQILPGAGILHIDCILHIAYWVQHFPQHHLSGSGIAPLEFYHCWEPVRNSAHDKGMQCTVQWTQNLGEESSRIWYADGLETGVRAGSGEPWCLLSWSDHSTGASSAEALSYSSNMRLQKIHTSPERLPSSHPGVCFHLLGKQARRRAVSPI